jgi:hypothetical protein
MHRPGQQTDHRNYKKNRSYYPRTLPIESHAQEQAGSDSSRQGIQGAPKGPTNYLRTVSDRSNLLRIRLRLGDLPFF